METRPAIFRALRHRDYRLYFWGQAVSLVGTWLQQAALVWLAYDLTGLSTWTGLVSMATILPTAFLAPFSGWLADLFAKKRIVQLAQTGMLIQAASLAILVWAGQATPERLVLWSLFAGLLQAIDLPTRLSFIKELTGPEDLANAVALNSMQFNLARALGPALAAGGVGFGGAGMLLRIERPQLCGGFGRAVGDARAGRNNGGHGCPWGNLGGGPIRVESSAGGTIAGFGLPCRLGRVAGLIAAAPGGGPAVGLA